MEDTGKNPEVVLPGSIVPDRCQTSCKANSSVTKRKDFPRSTPLDVHSFHYHQERWKINEHFRHQRSKNGWHLVIPGLIPHFCHPLLLLRGTVSKTNSISPYLTLDDSHCSFVTFSREFGPCPITEVYYPRLRILWVTSI